MVGILWKLGETSKAKKTANTSLATTRSPLPMHDEQVDGGYQSAELLFTNCYHEFSVAL